MAHGVEWEQAEEAWGGECAVQVEEVRAETGKGRAFTGIVTIVASGDTGHGIARRRGRASKGCALCVEGIQTDMFCARSPRRLGKVLPARTWGTQRQRTVQRQRIGLGEGQGNSREVSYDDEVEEEGEA